MSAITRDTHDDNKNYHKVVFQRAKQPLDSELNEAQDNMTVHRAESAFSTMGGLRPSQQGYSGKAIPFEAKGDGLAPRGAASPPNILLSAGDVFIEGLRFVFPVDVDLAAEGMVFTGVAPTDLYGIIYMDVAQTEINSGDDPIIATPQIGETTVRESLEITFGHVTSDTSFAAAFAAITAGAPASTDRLWKGNIARVLICRYFRPSSSTSVLDTNLYDYRQSTPNELLTRQVFIKTNRPYWVASTATWTGASEDGGEGTDGMVLWNVTSGHLVLGHIDDDLVDAAEGYAAGVSVYFPWAEDGLKYSSTRGVARKKTGAGDADGTAVIQETGAWTVGPLLNDGEALGWITVASGATVTTAYNNQPPGRNGRIANPLQTFVADASPEPGTYSSVATSTPAILVQRLVRETVKWFEQIAPHAFVLVRRKVNDLIWCNGQVTRGIPGRPVAVELGGQPVPFDAVVAVEGCRHFTGSDGVERAINWLRDASATGMGQDRHLKIHVRRGNWEMTRLLHQFGTAAEVTAQTAREWNARNNGIELLGEGPHVTKISTLSSTNASTTIIGNVNIFAHRVVIKGMTWEQEWSTTRPPRGTLYIEANDVEIEDCIFSGPILIKADRITIRRCHFKALGNGATATNRLTAGYGLGWIPESLRLDMRNAVTHQHKWVVEECTFNVGFDIGPHAKFILNGGALGQNQGLKVIVRNNSFQYINADGSPSTSRLPALLLNIPHGDIDIHTNHFEKANGVLKVGNDQTTDGAPPFDGFYGGSPIQVIGTGTAVDVGNLYVTCSYISCVGTRERNSRLRIRDNTFDMSSMGANASSKFTTWGACIFMTNSAVLDELYGVTDTWEVSNVEYCDNKHIMELITSSRYLLATNTWMSGFYMAPAWQDGNGITNLVFSNIKVNGNVFDIGGTTTVRTWRSVFAEDLFTWPAAGTGWMTDHSCLIGIVLKNFPEEAAGLDNSGRWAYGVQVNNNQILQRHPGGASLPTDGQITLRDDIGDTADPHHWLFMIYLDKAQHLAVGATGNVSGTETLVGAPARGFYGAADSQFVAPQVEGNTIVAPIYFVNPVTLPTDNPVAFIHVVGCFGGVIRGNYMYGTRNAEGVGGIIVGRSSRVHIIGNTVVGRSSVTNTTQNAIDSGAFTPSSDAPTPGFAGGNNLSAWNDGATPIDGDIVVTYNTGAQIGSNFNAP